MTLVPPGAATELRHGYSLADLERLAKISVTTDIWYQGMHPADRYELSLSAMAMHLYETDEPPTANELFRAASVAMRRQVQSDRSAHGISNTDVYTAAPNFYRFWWEQFQLAPSHEGRIVDRAALWQIFPVLARRHQAVLVSLAIHGDHDSAAAMLGITRATYNSYLSEARHAFLRLWHEGEQPSRLWAQDKRHGKGLDDHSVMHSIVRRRKRRIAGPH